MFETLSCWCAFAALLVVVRLVPPDRESMRAGVLAFVSLVAIIVVLHLSLAVAALIVASTAWIAAVVPRLSRGSSHPIRTALLAIAPVALLWAVGKIAFANQLPLGWLFFLGSSFFLVKAFSLIRDRIDGKAKNASPALIGAYLLYFPTYLSGPMHYWDEFDDAFRNPESLSGADAIDVAFRFTWGLFKVQVLAVLLGPLSLTALVTAPAISLPHLIAGALVYSWVLYFNFSGYVDMAIAVSRLIGLRVPENFHLPYLSQSIRDFWRRWHITFSRALTAHVFMPLSRTLATKVGTRRALVPVIGYLVTFIFAGFWHGATLNFLLWGAYHGVGLVGHDLYQRNFRKKGPPGPANIVTTSVSVAATYVFVSLGWIFFVLPVGQLGRIVWH